MPAGVKCNYFHQPQRMEPDDHFFMEEMPLEPFSTFQVYGKQRHNSLTGQDEWYGVWYDVKSTEESRAVHCRTLMTVWENPTWRHMCFDELKEEHATSFTVYPADAVAQELEEVFAGVAKVRIVLYCVAAAAFAEKVYTLIKETSNLCYAAVLNLYGGKCWTRADCRFTSILPIGVDCEVHVAGYPKFTVKVGTFVLLPGPVYIKVYTSHMTMSVVAA